MILKIFFSDLKVLTWQILHHSDIFSIECLLLDTSTLSSKSSHKKQNMIIKYNNQGEPNSKFTTQEGFHINIIEAINNVISKEISLYKSCLAMDPFTIVQSSL